MAELSMCTVCRRLQLRRPACTSCGSPPLAGGDVWSTLKERHERTNQKLVLAAAGGYGAMGIAEWATGSQLILPVGVATVTGLLGLGLLAAWRRRRVRVRGAIALLPAAQPPDRRDYAARETRLRARGATLVAPMSSMPCLALRHDVIVDKRTVLTSMTVADLLAHDGHHTTPLDGPVELLGSGRAAAGRRAGDACMLIEGELLSGRVIAQMFGNHALIEERAIDSGELIRMHVPRDHGAAAADEEDPYRSPLAVVRGRIGAPILIEPAPTELTVPKKSADRS